MEYFLVESGTCGQVTDDVPGLLGYLTLFLQECEEQIEVLLIV